MRTGPQSERGGDDWPPLLSDRERERLSHGSLRRAPPLPVRTGTIAGNWAAARHGKPWSAKEQVLQLRAGSSNAKPSSGWRAPI